MPRESNLGPLPEADDASALERKSLQAFRQVVPIDRLLVRDERTDDFGVDLSLEVLINSQATNCRGHVQIKGRSKLDPNSDGTFSAPFPVQSVNYLLNGPVPICVLYLPERDELRYLWLRDEVEQIRQRNNEWKSQETITLRFGLILDDGAIDPICDRIMDETLLHRNVHDAMCRLSDRDAVALVVEPASIAVSAPDENARLLEGGGFAIIASGFPSKVEELYGTLAHQDRTPRINLAYAYAVYSMGKYLFAEAILADLQADTNHLSDHDKHFFSFLENAVQYRVGRISREEFLGKKEVLRESAPGYLQIQYSLEDLVDRARKETSDNYLEAMLTEASPLFRQIEDLSDTTEWPLKYRGRMLHLFLKFNVWLRRFGRTAYIAHQDSATQARYFRGSDVVSEFAGHRRSWQKWEQLVESIVRSIETRIHPPLLCQALIMRASARVTFLFQVQLIGTITGSPTITVETPPADVRRDLDRAIEIADRARLLEESLRARLVLADLLDLTGSREEARSIAESVRTRAVAMRHGSLVAWADRHVSDKPASQEPENGSSDNDEGLAAMTDEEVHSFARSSMELYGIDGASLRELGIDDDRFSVVLRGAFCLRTAAIAKLDFCGNLEMREEQGHAKSLTTLFAVDPQRRFRCTRHGYQSLIPSSDGEAVLRAFQRTYCENCADRFPKRTASPD